MKKVTTLVLMLCLVLSGALCYAQGLLAGVKSGGMGAAMGGMTSGVTGGITALKHGGNFWTGEGSKFLYEAPADMTGKEKVGEGMEYSNEYANKFSERNFNKPKNLKTLHADGSVPDNYTMENGFFEQGSTKSLGISIKNKGLIQNYDVYLAENAFSCPERLYLVMGHEYMHLSMWGMGRNSEKFHHATIYRWEKDQADLWKYSDNVLNIDFWYEKYKNNYCMDYNNFIPIINPRPFP